ncbi:MAG: apolipoprotein N-acyltransferase [Polyangiales bacterium]
MLLCRPGACRVAAGACPAPEQSTSRAFGAALPAWSAMPQCIAPRHAFLVAWCAGVVAMAGGYYWLVGMLEHFSGFPWLACVAIAMIFYLYMGLIVGLWGFLVAWGARARWNLVLVGALALMALEHVFPMLFPAYLGASFHQLPALIQVADLGGPLWLSGFLVAVSGALYMTLRAAWARQRRLRELGVVLALTAAMLAYGHYRIGQVQAQAARAARIRVGLVQANMGLLAKRQDPLEGLRRHVQQSQQLEAEVQPDLLIWPESAFAWAVPSGVSNLKRYVTGPLRTALVFGGLSRRPPPPGAAAKRPRLYNTAFVLDAQGNVLGSYDKTFLLAFGEYLPGGETFPWLYDLSPNSGRFTPGSRLQAVRWRQWRLGLLVCYEDILPSFVNALMHVSAPDVLINLTNDAWFGDTHEPWIHLALAKFRAIEQHRDLVRATNSGVSAIIDALGRVQSHSAVFTRENLHGEVRRMTGRTLFSRLGPWPGTLSLLALIGMALRLWRRRA